MRRMPPLERSECLDVTANPATASGYSSVASENPFLDDLIDLANDLLAEDVVEPALLCLGSSELRGGPAAARYTWKTTWSHDVCDRRDVRWR